MTAKEWFAKAKEEKFRPSISLRTNPGMYFIMGDFL